MKVPFGDLRTQYQSIKSDIDNAIRSVIDETAFIRGKYVAEFEKAYAAMYGVKHCISCANGTDAIYITLKMLGIGPGDEVITVANSWISTSETITQTGARPVFVDIEPDYYTIDVSKIEEKITSRTKVVLPVHLYGQPAEIERIKEICKTYNLHLVEDCAQSHFAEYKGRRVGTFGIAGTFSFYPGKNLGAYGDAGAIITNDDDLAKMSTMYANHGALKKHLHEMEGINSRMDGLQAAILTVKLPHINEWNQKRYTNALLYSERLKDCKEIHIPGLRPNSTHIFHLYVIRTERREELQSYLNDYGIETAIHYPTSLPFLKAYAYLGHCPDDFPVAYRYQKEILSLPMYPELSEDMIDYVTTKIREFFK
ncbi:MAG: DegT/DnrJ/EryC1/StrS family aminotransferase [Nitrospirae bacterium]|nr:DegT/DnrJ/EryC1/StrS family aminotransferase [Nitrospirota bacterium]